MSEMSAAAEAAVMEAALRDHVLRSTWPRRRAERLATVEQLIGEAVHSEFMSGGHFVELAGNVVTLGRDEETAKNRTFVVSKLLNGKPVCTRGQLLVKHFFDFWSDESLDTLLNALSQTTYLGMVRIDAHRHAENVVLLWHQL